jgi:hypothetical protein
VASRKATRPGPVLTGSGPRGDDLGQISAVATKNSAARQPLLNDRTVIDWRGIFGGGNRFVGMVELRADGRVYTVIAHSTLAETSTSIDAAIALARTIARG